MPAQPPIIDFSTIDFDQVVADREAIDRLLPQRFEMEQLTAIVLDDVERGIVVGYKDTTADDFWVRGHVPGNPLMPGVIMCEAAAQVCSYHVMANRLMEAAMIGFAGLDSVRFRGKVSPGDRLVIAAQKLQLRPKTMVRCRFQCHVGESLVCEGEMLGAPLPAV
ncbi:MAG: 3-hydroxyacyl-ACP dehydratase FabZ family protein [Planctomycetota bacterium]